MRDYLRLHHRSSTRNALVNTLENSMLYVIIGYFVVTLNLLELPRIPLPVGAMWVWATSFEMALIRFFGHRFPASLQWNRLQKVSLQEFLGLGTFYALQTFTFFVIGAILATILH